jgi:outer membrane receptor protein involved in Fe transport
MANIARGSTTAGHGWCVRAGLMTTVALAALASAFPAQAQTASQDTASSAPTAGVLTADPANQPDAASGDNPRTASAEPAGPDTAGATDASSEPQVVGEVTVTGSRIVRDGYSAPTPVTVLGAAEIAAQAPANISDFVNQLPAISGSGTAATSSGSLSNGIAGVNSISLRGLGAGRTLVLLDGQRSVASTVGGVVDINTFPQDLIERVEVVTGGASAQYGSDAVGGVVNFILNKGFRGFKLSVDQGISTYGDGRNYRLAASAGLGFLDDRLRILLNGEYFRQKAVTSINRDWNDSGYFQINNPAYTPTNGEPQRLVGSGLGPATYTAGGLITSGPLRGTYFLGDGQTRQLAFGTTNSVSSPWMIGGDYQTTLAGHAGTNSLLPKEERIGVFNRTSFDVSDALQVYGQFSWNRYSGASFYQQTPSTGVTIQRDNAYLLQQYAPIAAALAGAGATAFTMGTSNAGFPVPGSDNVRDVYRYVAGATGKFTLFDNRWSWNAYYQHGTAKVHAALTNTWNVQRMALAQDAVFAPAGNSAGLAAGSIVCRSTLADPGNGCVPIDRLGTAGPSAEALAYIYGEQPYRDETIKQDVAAFSVSGELFALPGGALAIAFGGEHRKEQISGFVEEQFRPVVNANGTTTSRWLYGNYLPNEGHYTVKEAFLEIDAPLLPGLNINAAGRYTDYSTSGSVQTWKVGGTYTPIPDIKLRGTYSHDIRAPNLSELFAAGTARTNTVILPTNSPMGAGSFQFIENTVGNQALKPETADTWTAGIVLTPSFLPGFSASFDYYDIKISKSIGTITSQNTVDNCYNLGIDAYCENIVYTGGALSRIILQPFNFASQREKGFDIEASYRTELSNISAGLPGNFSIHANATHYIQNVIDNGIFPIDYAGVNGGSLSGSYSAPDWTYRVSAFYDIEPFTFNLVGRGFSDGVYGNDYIECTTGCPTSSTQFRTINDNNISGSFYVDSSISVKFDAEGHEARLTLVANNLFNRKPVLIGNGPDANNVPAYTQTNRSLYDVVGRVFRIAASVKF